jgi:predicted Rossmann fold nucleotide-binding protein DprA/Smf involved in DNA uptake
MIYGVVGNRKGWHYIDVHENLLKLEVTSDDAIVSGGADGIDTFAQYYAKKIGCEMVILYPNPKEPSPQRYFNRNLEIAKRCDILVAFDKGSSNGSGTLNTINHAKRLGKELILIKE